MNVDGNRSEFLMGDDGEILNFIDTEKISVSPATLELVSNLIEKRSPLEEWLRLQAITTFRHSLDLGSFLPLPKEVADPIIEESIQHLLTAEENVTKKKKNPAGLLSAGISAVRGAFTPLSDEEKKQNFQRLVDIVIPKLTQKYEDIQEQAMQKIASTQFAAAREIDWQAINIPDSTISEVIEGRMFLSSTQKKKSDDAGGTLPPVVSAKDLRTAIDKAAQSSKRVLVTLDLLPTIESSGKSKYSGLHLAAANATELKPKIVTIDPSRDELRIWYDDYRDRAIITQTLADKTYEYVAARAKISTQQVVGDGGSGSSY